MQIRTFPFAASLLLVAWRTGTAPAQVLQDGDLVVIALRQDAGGQYGGNFLRVRGQDVSMLFAEPANSGYDFEGVGDILIDSAGRVVFAAGGCGGNSNNTALLRWDPATSEVSELLCLPNIVPPEGPPQGFPTDATHFDGVFGLQLTRSLRVSIDDDVSGGTPQVGYVEAYVFALRYENPQFPPMRLAALRYLPDTGEVEPGFAFIENSDNRPLLFTGDQGTYYAIAGGGRIYRVEADLNIDLRAHTTVGGTDIVVTGRLRVAGRNELLFDGGVIDNTAIANGTVNCGPVSDDNVPFDGIDSFRVLTGILSLGVLDGGIFACSNSGAAGFPWLFDLAPRAPFLNPYVCAFFPCNQHYGPYQFFQDPPGFSYSTVHNGRVLGASDSRVFAVNRSSYEVLAFHPLIFAPKDVAAYPAETPALTAATLVVRVDSPVNVLVTDAAGRSIGHDAAGNTVNDFGASGAVMALGPEGHPRVYAVINPAEGDYALQAVGTGDGAYTIRGYRADTAIGGSLATITGNSTEGVVESFTLSLSAGLGVAIRRPCRADWNRADGVDSQDYFDFLEAFFGGDADFNGIDGTDAQDYFDFLEAFFSGCA